MDGQQQGLNRDVTITSGEEAQDRAATTRLVRNIDPTQKWEKMT